MKRILFFTMCFAFTFASLSAQNYDQVIWTGDGDGYSWEDDFNWARGGDPNLPGVPEPYDDILIEFAYVYYNGLGSVVPLNQEYGSLELRFGAHLFTQGDFHLMGDFIVDPQSTLEVVVRDVDYVNTITCYGNYFFNGTMQLNFSGYVPQIGQEFFIIDGYQGSCSTPQSFNNEGDGFEATLGAQCEFEGLSYVVTDLAYTTAYAWDDEGGDNQWNTAANWNQNTIPPPGATIIINLPGSGAYVETNGAGITEAHTIYIGHNNTLEVNGDLLVEKFIYLSDLGTFTWGGGKLYSPDENQQSALISYGEIIMDGGLKELDTNFNIWQFFGDINHYEGDLDINNGIIRMFNFNSYNINGDNITIGYSSGDLHEMTISVISELKKTNGSGTSSINLTTFVNYGEIISEFGTLAINEDLVSGEYQEYIDGELVEYVGTYSGSGSFQFPTGYVFDGEMSPGSSPGTLTVIGDLITAPEADFIIEIDGPTVGTEYDQVVVTDDAKLEGNINVRLGYLPANDASFEILTASSISLCNLPQQVTANYNGTSYTFDVVCHNNKVYLNGPGAILSDSEIEADTIGIYPNPIQNELNIKLQTPSEGSWLLFNELGQKIMEGQLQGIDTKISTTNLGAGFYALQIKDRNKTTVTVKKIVKN